MDFLRIAALIAAAWSVEAKIYLKEDFTDGESYADRWVASTSKDGMGAFKLSSGKFYGDVEKDKGLQTSEDARFYGISTKFDSFSNEGKPLVIQFQVKHEQSIDCGGGYVKIYASDLDQKLMHGDSPYHIMFGPDICGSTKRVHVIFTYKGVNHLVKKEIPCKEDEMTHLYTLIVSPDNTYQVKIDGEEAQKGSLEEDWDMLPAKEILDPEQSKPADWVDSDTMPDPEDTKPEDWDRPAHIPDSEASKPADWDDDMDGEWEAPMVDNPEYKGEWKPKEIPNPAYKGPWVHPKIANPEYAPNPLLYRYEDIGALGFDLWQVKSGTIFDNIIITDDPLEAEAFAKETFEITKVAEKKMKDEMDEAKKAEEAAEDAKDKEGKDDDDDAEEDDDDVDDEGDEEAKDADADAEPDVDDEDLEEVTGEPGQDGGAESHDEL
jgi:calreticulin